MPVTTGSLTSLQSRLYKDVKHGPKFLSYDHFLAIYWPRWEKELENSVSLHILWWHVTWGRKSEPFKLRLLHGFYLIYHWLGSEETR